MSYLPGDKPIVGLFVTCIVDIMRPQIGFAAVKLLEQSGCRIEVASSQTCCGQPAFNSGDNKNTIGIAKQVISTFERYDYIVAPSGSCAAMIKIHYPEALSDDEQWLIRAKHLANKTYELISFLVDVRRLELPNHRLEKTITYHDSCSGHNELGIYKQPRQLLGAINGLSLNEMKDSSECCGFGGTFCVKYPDISNAMVSDKSDNIENSDTELVVGGDYGCLMNIAGKLNRRQSNVQACHIAELLATMSPPDS